MFQEVWTDFMETNPNANKERTCKMKRDVEIMFQYKNSGAEPNYNPVVW